jgi:hypothetical protein
MFHCLPMLFTFTLALTQRPCVFDNAYSYQTAYCCNIQLARTKLLRTQLPRIQLPRIQLPRIQLPRIQLPRIKNPTPSNATNTMETKRDAMFLLVSISSKPFELCCSIVHGLPTNLGIYTKGESSSVEGMQQSTSSPSSRCFGEGSIPERKCGS